MLELVLGMLGSSVLSSIVTFVATRPKMSSEIEFNEVAASEKNVQMALSIAEAADRKAKDIETKLKQFQTDFTELQGKFGDLTNEYVSLLRYVDKCKKVVAVFDPNHPILRHEKYGMNKQ